MTRFDLLEHPEYLEDEFHGKFEPDPAGYEKRQHGIDHMSKIGGVSKHKYIDAKKVAGKEAHRHQEKAIPKVIDSSDTRHDLSRLHA